MNLFLIFISIFLPHTISLNLNHNVLFSRSVRRSNIVSFRKRFDLTTLYARGKRKNDESRSDNMKNVPNKRKASPQKTPRQSNDQTKNVIDSSNDEELIDVNSFKKDDRTEDEFLESELDKALQSIEEGKFELDDFDLSDEAFGGGIKSKTEIDEAEIDLSDIPDLSDVLNDDLTDFSSEDKLLMEEMNKEFNISELTDMNEENFDDSLVSEPKPSKREPVGKKKTRKGKQTSEDIGELDITKLEKSLERSLNEIDEPLVIDGVQLNREDVDLGVEPPPLEEFKRLMESLGPDAFWEEESIAKSNREDSNIDENDVDDEPIELSEEEKAWSLVTYEGGSPERPGAKFDENKTLSEWTGADMRPAPFRLQVVSVITDSAENNTALKMVQHVYTYLKNATNNDPRISYQIHVHAMEDGKPIPQLIDIIQMWCEGYNTYHLIDGAAMKEAWGAIMPHIMLSEKNLKAILDRVIWALEEDNLDGVLLSPRMRTIRFRGGAKEMTTGYNTDRLESEFSVVSVR